MDDSFYNDGMLRKRDVWYQLYEEMHNHPIRIEPMYDDFKHNAALHRGIFTECNTLTAIAARRSMKIAAAELMTTRHEDVLMFGLPVRSEITERENFFDCRLATAEHLQSLMDSGKLQTYSTIFLTGVSAESMKEAQDFLITNRLVKNSVLHPDLKIIILVNTIN